ncbi:MAG TPA: HAMP domain-containing sensor histidine kinase, partial [Dokdonella sp.]
HGAGVSMQRHDGIRRKIWAVFIQQTTAVSLAGLLGLYVVAALIEDRVLCDVLSLETAEYVRRVGADPNAAPPTTHFLRGYLARPGAAAPPLPPGALALAPGFHRLGGASPAAVMITDTPAGRFYLLFPQDRLHRYVLVASFALIGVILVTVYVTAWMAYRASRRALAPVIVLADVVRGWDPKRPDLDALLPDNLPVNVEVDRDVGSLALALHGFAVRLEDFVERERNFTRDASHELRTPLTVIKVGADMLLDEEELPLFARRTGARIHRAARDMEALIDSFLILAREDGVGLPEEDFTVNDVVREEIERARMLVDDKPVHLSFEERAVFGLHTSPRAFGVLVGNLIRNACMYTERGAVTVVIDDGVLLVRDTGVGMSDEDVSHIFESFYRGSAGRAEGHGIGLSIVKRLADRFGWTVGISSKLGVGTTISVSFPVAEDDAANAVAVAR